MVDTLETTRAKLLTLSGTLKNKKEIHKVLNMENKLWEIESKVFDVYQTGARMDAFRNPVKLLERFLTISKESIGGGADFSPTEQHLAVYNLLKTQLDEVMKQYQTFISRQESVKINMVHLNNSGNN